MDAFSLRTTAIVSSCPLRAVASIVASILLATAAITGQAHSIRAARPTRGDFASIRTITASAYTTATIVSMDSQFGLYALGCRTNFCSVNDKSILPAWFAMRNKSVYIEACHTILNL